MGSCASTEMLHEFKEYLGYGWPEFGTLPSSVSPDEDGLTLKIKIMVTTVRLTPFPAGLSAHML